MIAGIFVAGCIVLFIGYRLYGAFLERQFDINPKRKTPAVTMTDGVDYVPAKPPVLFGHHFSSIAGAGPIVGPIAAGLAFGWLPALLWIVIGSIFIGGTHDFAALVTSIRHKSRSIGEVCRLYLSPTTYRLFLGFVWLALVYVLIVFLDLTASTFAPATAGMPAEKVAALKHLGGSVATASIIYIALALLFGLLTNRTRLGLMKGSLVFVPLVFVALFVSQKYQLHLSTSIAGSPAGTWSIILLLYCFAASILPVWMLLQPRDYLSSWLLYACVVFGGLGLLASSILGSMPARYPAFVTFNDPGLGFLFPALFITIACGAVSGFHSVVASGTTAKQLPSESAAKPVAYGSMLVEAVLGIIALATIMYLAEATPQAPTAVFSQGVGQFLTIFHVPVSFGSAFGLLAVSTFLLTTLDTCTRLARYILEEMLSLRGTHWRYITTALTLALPLAIVFYKIPNPAGGFLPAWKAVWPVFGATNQLLAAMALLVVFVWRVHLKRPVYFVAIPMVLMMVITGTGLVQLLWSSVKFGPFTVTRPLIGGLSALLLAMAIALLIDTARSWKKITTARGIEEKEERAPAMV